MGTFFKVASGADLALLHKSVRGDDELANVVDQIEWELIDYFKQRPTVPIYFRSGLENLSTLNEVVVRLFDYDSDNPENSGNDLKEALRRTIADIASWVLRNYYTQDRVRSITQGKRSVTYMGTVPSWRDWPDGWAKRLKNFDNREALYSI